MKLYEKKSIKDIISVDGMRIRVYESFVADAERVVVFCNANCATPTFVSKLALYLNERKISVMTFDTRGTNPDELFNIDTVKPSHIARDIISILDNYGIKKATLVGYCSGAENALMVCRDYADYIEQAILVNGAFSLANGPKTNDASVLEEMTRAITESPESAELYFQFFDSGGKDTLANQLTDSGSDYEQAFKPTDLLCYCISPEMLYRYCVTFTSFVDNDVLRWAPLIKSKTVFIASKLDQMAHPEQSKIVASSIADSQYILRETGDHYSLLNSNELYEMIYSQLKHVA